MAAVALIGSYELFMMIIRGAQESAEVPKVAETSAPVPHIYPLNPRSAVEFADEVAAGHMRSITSHPGKASPRSTSCPAGPDASRRTYRSRGRQGTELG